MDNMGCISCIKDGVTGICRDIKDKTAREQIATIQEQITALGGVDITALQKQLTELSNKIDSLDLTYATDEDIQRLQSAIDLVNDSLSMLDKTYAKDSDITTLQGQISELSNTINNLDNTYAKDTDITALSNTISALDSGFANVINGVNNAKQNKLTAGNGIKIENDVISETSKIIFEGSFAITEGASLTLDIPTNTKMLIFAFAETNTCRGGEVFDNSKSNLTIFNLHVQSNGNCILKTCNMSRNGNTFTFSNCRETKNFGDRTTTSNLYLNITEVVAIS